MYIATWARITFQTLTLKHQVLRTIPLLNPNIKHRHQRKGVRRSVVRQPWSLKYVNNVSCVDQLCSVKHAPNVPNIAKNLPVGPDYTNFGKLGKPWGPDTK